MHFVRQIRKLKIPLAINVETMSKTNVTKIMEREFEIHYKYLRFLTGR